MLRIKLAVLTLGLLVAGTAFANVSARVNVTTNPAGTHYVAFDVTYSNSQAAATCTGTLEITYQDPYSGLLTRMDVNWGPHTVPPGLSTSRNNPIGAAIAIPNYYGATVKKVSCI